MLIARATAKDGNDILILGLSAENRRRLEAGNPIDLTTYTHGAAIPKELHIVIFAGETEDSMRVHLDALIARDTVVVDRRQPRRDVQ